MSQFSDTDPICTDSTCVYLRHLRIVRCARFESATSLVIYHGKQRQPTIRKAGIVDVTFGNGVTVVEPVNLYGCAIGDDCFHRAVCRNPARRGDRKAMPDPVPRVHLRTRDDRGRLFHFARCHVHQRCLRRGGPAKGRQDLWRSTRIGNESASAPTRPSCPSRFATSRDWRRSRRDQGHHGARHLRRQSGPAARRL